MSVPNEKKVISIGLIDSYAIMRMGLTRIFHDHFRAVRIIEASSIDDFLETGKDTEPDVVLFGINNKSKAECLAKASRLRSAFPHQKLIVYDDLMEPSLIVSYFKLRINGYIHSNNGGAEMLRCIEDVLQGRFHLSPELTTLLLTQLARSIPNESSRKELSGRESEVARYLCQGMKTSLIAQTLRRKPSTISTIKHNILRKMDVKNVIELMIVLQRPVLGLPGNSMKASMKGVTMPK